MSMVDMILKIKPGLIPRFNIDYGTSDLFFALMSIKKEPDMSPVMNIFKNCHVSWTNSGRTCLYTILKALELPDKSRIGVPLYNCPSDFDAIINAGHVPVFIDIDQETLTLSPDDLKRKINGIDAVVVVHTFGRPADMDKILSICGNKPIIEDCAHSLMSKYNGCLTGTLGIAGFFSFRSGKYISSGEGGLIVTKDKELSKKINTEIESYVAPSPFNEISHSFITFFRSTLYHRPWFGLFSLPLGKLLEKKVDIMNKHSFKKSRARRCNLQTLSKKINNFDECVTVNRSNSCYLIDNLDSFGMKLPQESQNIWCNYFLFPIIFDNPIIRDKVSNLLFEKGIDNAKMFAKTQYEYIGDCPVTELVSKRILIIPHYYKLKRKDLDKIIRETNYAINQEDI